MNPRGFFLRRRSSARFAGLRQENDYLRRQRDILKKACSILSAEVQPSDLG